MTLDTTALAAYLRRLDYAEQSITSTCQRASALERLRADNYAEAFAPHWRTYLLRIAAAGEAGAVDPALGRYAGACLEAMNLARLAAREARQGRLRGGRKPKEKRKRETVSVADDAWARLLAELAKPRANRAEAGAAAVLLVQAGTALRVGDVLRIPRDALAAGVASGTLEFAQKGGRVHTIYTSGAPEAWARLAAFCADAPRGLSNVAACVSGKSAEASSSGAAYKRCALFLHRLEKELGIDRLHTHRLRRTVAVQILRMTHDVVAVGEILQHAPGSRATFGYVDEARPERAAALTAAARKQFGGGA